MVGAGKATKEKDIMLDTSELLFTIKIAGKLSNNNSGQTKHWSSAHKAKKKWMLALRHATVTLPSEGELEFNYYEFLEHVLADEPIAQLVGIEIQRVLGPRERKYDPDSVLRGEAKQLVDSLVGTNLLTDDSCKHILWAVGTQAETRAKESHVLIRFYGVDK